MQAEEGMGERRMYRRMGMDVWMAGAQERGEMLERQVYRG